MFKVLGLDMVSIFIVKFRCFEFNYRVYLIVEEVGKYSLIVYLG